MQLKKEFNYIELLVVSILCFSLLGYLTIRGITNIGAILLASIGLYLFAKKYSLLKKEIGNKNLLIIFLAYCSVFIANLLSQFFKNPFQISSFDGPVRLLLGFFIFITFFYFHKHLLRILTFFIPISLLCLFIDLYFFDKAYTVNWGGRYASYFVDPNTLGGQCAILSSICLSLLISSERENVLIRFLLAIGFLAGFITLFYAQSRGGWLTFFLLVFLIIFTQHLYLKRIHKQKISLLVFLGLFIFFVCFFYFNQNYLLGRLSPLSGEILLWNHNASNLGETSVGARLGMWEVSFLLIQESPFFGFGERSLSESIKLFSNKIPSHLVDPLQILIGTGPHSDFLAKMLSSGLLGAGAYCFTLGVPLFYFVKSFLSQDKNSRSISILGIIYICGVLICGLFNETLSLKYLCSFYSIVTAALLAIIFSNPIQSHNGPK